MLTSSGLWMATPPKCRWKIIINPASANVVPPVSEFVRLGAMMLSPTSGGRPSCFTRVLAKACEIPQLASWTRLSIMAPSGVLECYDVCAQVARVENAWWFVPFAQTFCDCLNEIARLVVAKEGSLHVCYSCLCCCLILQLFEFCFGWPIKTIHDLEDRAETAVLFELKYWARWMSALVKLHQRALCFGSSLLRWRCCNNLWAFVAPLGASLAGGCVVVALASNTLSSSRLVDASSLSQRSFSFFSCAILTRFLIWGHARRFFAAMFVTIRLWAHMFAGLFAWALISKRMHRSVNLGVRAWKLLLVVTGEAFLWETVCFVPFVTLLHLNSLVCLFLLLWALVCCCIPDSVLCW